MEWPSAAPGPCDDLLPHHRHGNSRCPPRQRRRVWAGLPDRDPTRPHRGGGPPGVDECAGGCGRRDVRSAGLGFTPTSVPPRRARMSRERCSSLLPGRDDGLQGMRRRRESDRAARRRPTPTPPAAPSSTASTPCSPPTAPRSSGRLSQRRTRTRMPSDGCLAPRSECLDWLLIRGERHLIRVLAECIEHYNQARPHRSRDLRPPCASAVGPPPPRPAQRTRRRDRSGGLIHVYEPAAA